MTRSSPTGRRWLVAGLGAGLVSGVTAAAFAAFAAVRAGLPATTPFAFVASAVGGSALGESPSAAAAGVLFVFIITVLWAFGYVYAAKQQPQLLTRPLLSGTGFGVIVWFVTQAMLVGAGRYTAPTIYSFDRDMVAFIVFFGIPLAVVAARLLRAR